MVACLDGAVQRFAAVQACCDVEGPAAGSDCRRVGREKARSDEDVIALGPACCLVDPDQNDAGLGRHTPAESEFAEVPVLVPGASVLAQ
jgi:hypothetical protein